MKLFAVAANNGQQTPQQKNQDCLNKINNTPDGKFYNNFSYLQSVIGPDAGWGAAGQDAASEAAQRGGQRFFKAAAKNWKRTGLGSMSGVVSEEWEAVDGFLLTPLSGSATAGQLAVHAGCFIASQF